MIGADEAVSLDHALGPVPARCAGRRVGPDPGLGRGAPGDLCVLDTDWTTLAADAPAVEVHATWIGGRPVHGPAELSTG